MTRTAQLRLDLANNNTPITSEISRQVDSDRHKHDKSSTQTYGGKEQTTTGDKLSVKTTDGRRSSDKIPRDSQGKTSQRYGEKRSVTADGRNHQMKAMTQQRSKLVATNSRLPRPNKVYSGPSSAPVSYYVPKYKPLQLPAKHSVNNEVKIKTSDQQTTKSDVATRSGVPKSQSIAMTAACNVVPDPEHLKMDQSDIIR